MKVPSTSHEAYESMKPVISDHHAKIVAALDEIGDSIYERIATHIGWDDKNRCSRRMKELELKGVIEKTGDKALTSSGRYAFKYRLVPPKVVRSVGDEKVIQISLFQ